MCWLRERDMLHHGHLSIWSQEFAMQPARFLDCHHFFSFAVCCARSQSIRFVGLGVLGFFVFGVLLSLCRPLHVGSGICRCNSARSNVREVTCVVFCR